MLVFLCVKHVNILKKLYILRPQFKPFLRNRQDFFAFSKRYNEKLKKGCLLIYAFF